LNPLASNLRTTTTSWGQSSIRIFYIPELRIYT